MVTDSRRAATPSPPAGNRRTPPGSTDVSAATIEAAFDVALLRRTAAGDRAALGELYDRFARRVYSLARRVCGHHGAAEDVTQEVFLTVWRSAGRFDPARGSVTSWLLTVAHHRAVDAVRREATARRHTGELADEDGEASAAPGADLAAVGSLVALQVRGALADLPPAQRQVLALAYYGGHTQSEMAAILRIPVGTVKSRTFTAMAQLRTRLEPLADHP